MLMSHLFLYQFELSVGDGTVLESSCFLFKNLLLYFIIHHIFQSLLDWGL